MDAIVRAWRNDLKEGAFFADCKRGAAKYFRRINSIRACTGRCTRRRVILAGMLKQVTGDRFLPKKPPATVVP